MSIISYVVIILLFAAAIAFMIYKQNSVGRLNKAIQGKDYAKVIELCEKDAYQKAVGKFNCELYRLKAIYRSRPEAERQKALEEALAKDYTMENKEEILDLYFHIYLQNQNRAYCDKLMEIIDSIDDETFKMYQHWSYEVVFNKRTDLIKEMDDAIEDKRMKGFGLGVSAYMIGLSYYYLENWESSRSYFYSSISCFHPGNMYVELAKKYVNELNEKLGSDITI